MIASKKGVLGVRGMCALRLVLELRLLNRATHVHFLPGRTMDLRTPVGWYFQGMPTPAFLRCRISSISMSPNGSS